MKKLIFLSLYTLIIMVTAVCDDNSPTSTDSIALTESKQETAALFVPASDQ
jgi:hypothetical protein